MKFKIWKRARNIERGVRVYPDGHEVPFAHDGDFYSAFRMPVIWNGEQAVMHFHSDGPQINPIASQLLNHPDLSIGGRVEIITHVERRYKMRVWAREEYIRDAISSLQFDIPPVFGLFDWTVVDIYADTPSDLVAVRMCI